MQILIVHSHLNPGGVTRVIESQLESLKGLPVKVIVGSCPNPESVTSQGAELVIIEELNYLERQKYTDQKALQLLHTIHRKLRVHFTEDTILHVHNLNLGKNPIVTYVVYLLAKEGAKVFNHAHDFAEDRPSNLTFLKEILTDIFLQDINEVMYPKLPNYHFGVLNSHDQERLISYGVSAERIMWLPNPVSLPHQDSAPDKLTVKKEICNTLSLTENKLLVTYPVRVIQRKNIGELILLSLLFDRMANFVVTQPPKNPVEIEMYKQWKEFCVSNDIKIVFEAGEKVDFELLLAASNFCITTSYREGFGMVYLEPWLMDTPVVGRDIDYITKDFKNDGFIFPTMYYKLSIPGIKADFKELNMKMQMEIIGEVLTGHISKQKVFEQNPILNTLFNKVSEQTIENNKTIIKNNYSLHGYGIKLQERYKEILGTA